MEMGDTDWYNTDNDNHEMKTVAECIEFWAGRDDWGVKNIYIHTLNGIFKAFGLEEYCVEEECDD